MARPFLVPNIGAKVVDGETVAESLPVWLRLETADGIRTGHWIRLRYRSSFLADNVRPLIRFTDALGETTIQPMNGALFGIGEWVGYIPENIVEISISPTMRTGPIDFSVERLDYISPIRMILRGLAVDPLAVVWCLRAWWLGAPAVARRGLKFSGSSTSLSSYHEWQTNLSRDVDLNGIDRPRVDWNRTPHFHLFMAVDSNAVPALRVTIQSLLAQIYPHWSLHCVIDDHCNELRRQEIEDALGDDSRMKAVSTASPWPAIASSHSAGDLCASIELGDRLTNIALAAIAEKSVREPSARLFYGDEDAISSIGRLHTPVLRPDWSPYFQTERGYIGPTVWLYVNDALRHSGVGSVRLFSDFRMVIDAVLAGCAADEVCHIRRVLCRRNCEPDAHSSRQRSIASARTRADPKGLESPPEVGVIVLSRDNPECLSACIDGLLHKTDYPSLQITLVDNGSVKHDTLTFLRDLKRHERITILERPGPFNYAALCNDAARTVQSPMLVFLNDDTAVSGADWLKPLVYWAMRPDVGVAGAKLLFPNGRIQHAGVVIGMGGIAAHLYHNKSQQQTGYLKRLTAAHEVSAVTAACIAIERRKFELVNGFDAVHLPIELNDIDLCLRLAERGFSTMWTPKSVMTHRESASRGRTWSGDVYRAERRYFVDRWQDAIRDDKYFHPDLSLFSYMPALA